MRGKNVDLADAGVNDEAKVFAWDQSEGTLRWRVVSESQSK